ncbi:Bug family tripartite tricarboxylate transporter substrate binding protein [Advenella kashmirensis]
MKLEMSIGVIACVLGFTLSPDATYAASEFPSKPIRLIVGFPPGGGADQTARVVADELGRQLKQSIIVENRAGAGGAIAAETVARSDPDGYTLLLGNTGSMTINPAIYRQLRYDPLKDFVPVGLVAESPLLILLNGTSSYKNIDQFKTAAMKAPGKVNYGSGGTGSIGHLTGALFSQNLGVELTHVPYRGGSPAVTDLMGNQIEMVVEGTPIGTPLIQSNKLKALMVTSDKRLNTLPDVPTASEAGMSDFVIQVWYGILAPAGTAAPIVRKLNEALNVSLRTPDILKKFENQGASVAPGAPQAFTTKLQDETNRWKIVVKDARVPLQ